jgi:hypothetical protein
MSVVRRERATADKRRKQALSAWPEARFKTGADADEMAERSGDMAASQDREAKRKGLNASSAGNDERVHHTKLTKRTK